MYACLCTYEQCSRLHCAAVEIRQLSTYSYITYITVLTNVLVDCDPCITVCNSEGGYSVASVTVCGDKLEGVASDAVCRRIDLMLIVDA